MKITAISDLHGIFPDIKSSGDVLCICGDILKTKKDKFTTIIQQKKEFYKFNNWCNTLNFDKIIFIAGNHDFLFEQEEEFKKILEEINNPKLVYLRDSLYVYQGIQFYGSPWVENLPNWAFYKNSEDIRKMFNNIPSTPRIDVLLTHTPPKFNKFGVVLGKYPFTTDYGSLNLANAINDKKPRWSIFGHIHTGRHERLYRSLTTYANCSLLNEKYELAFPPLDFVI